MSTERWQSHIDRQLQELLESGQLEDLPGAGEPLDLSGNPFEPNDMRVANKLMRDNNVSPEWVSLGKALEEKKHNLSAKVRRAKSEYERALGAANSAHPDRQARAKSNAKRRLQSAKRNLEIAARQYNDDVRRYNLMIPPPIPARKLYDLEQAFQILRDE